MLTVLLKLRLMRLCHRAGFVAWGGICFLSFGPKGRNSIAQGAALGHEPVRSSQPQRGETPAMSPWSDAPLGLVDVLRSVTQGCALGYRVSPRWGKAAKQWAGPNDDASLANTRPLAESLRRGGADCGQAAKATKHSGVSTVGGPPRSTRLATGPGRETAPHARRTRGRGHERGVCCAGRSAGQRES